MVRALILLSAIAAACAAPAIVWKNGASSSTHSSEHIGASSLLKTVIHDSSLASVVFVVGRDHAGAESLSKMASSGKLPRTQEKYESAHSVHHHVSGVESHRSVAKDVAAAGREVVEMSLGEFNSMMTSAEKPVGGRVVAVVHTGKHDAAEAIDAAVVSAVDAARFENVVLTAQRSVEEVKAEREVARRRNKAISRPAGRRRLDDQNNNNGNNDEDDDTYYVNMTPNMLAGLLFTFMFIFVTQLGLNCMGAITHSDVFTTKLPSIGREV